VSSGDISSWNVIFACCTTTRYDTIALLRVDSLRLVLKRRLQKHGVDKAEIRICLEKFGDPTLLAKLALHHCHDCERVIDLRCRKCNPEMDVWGLYFLKYCQPPTRNISEAYYSESGEVCYLFEERTS